MTTPWELYNEVSKNNTRNYSTYRCPEPSSVKTGEPWFPYSNICPCDPNLSNKTGRGYTACTFGIAEPEKIRGPAINSFKRDMIPQRNQVVGSLFSQNQTVPPQSDPDPFVRIGQAWRTVD